MINCVSQVNCCNFCAVNKKCVQEKIKGHKKILLIKKGTVKVGFVAGLDNTAKYNFSLCISACSINHQVKNGFCVSCSRVHLLSLRGIFLLDERDGFLLEKGMSLMGGLSVWKEW